MHEEEQFLVDQERFRGTLSELAHALRTRSLPPAHLDLYGLVRSYLTYFERHSADLDVATEALPRLAQVIELKVRLLLPRPPKEEERAEEEATELALEAVALLEELEEAIDFLRRRREERRIVVPARTPTPPYPRKERPLKVTPTDLARLAGRYRIGGYFEVAIERLTLASVARRIIGALARLGSGLLHDLLGSDDWSTRTVGLAAVLELVKEGRVTAQQDDPYGPISVRATQRLTVTDPAEGRGATPAGVNEADWADGSAEPWTSPAAEPQAGMGGVAEGAAGVNEAAA